MHNTSCNMEILNINTHSLSSLRKSYNLAKLSVNLESGSTVARETSLKKQTVHRGRNISRPGWRHCGEEKGLSRQPRGEATQSWIVCYTRNQKHSSYLILQVCIRNVALEKCCGAASGKGGKTSELELLTVPKPLEV